MRNLITAALLLSCMGVALAARVVRGETTGESDEPKSRFSAPITGKDLLPSLVRVEVTTHYDGSTAPYGGGEWPGTHMDVSYPQLLKEQRPAELAGWLISPDRVICPDLMLHPRFIEGIKVRQRDQLVSAKIESFGVKQEAVILRLEKPLEGGKPVRFVEGGGKGPYTSFTFTQDETDFVVHAHPVPATADVTETGEAWLNLYYPCLIVDAAGHAVGMSFNELVPDDNAWKDPPEKWEWLSDEQHSALVEKTTKFAAERVLSVTLNLRSPTASPQTSMRFSSGGNNEDATVIHCLGVLVDPGTVLVLTELKPKTTSRLERIQVQPARGDAAGATFVASLRDYGAFVAKLDKALEVAGPAASVLGDKDLRPLRQRLLPAGEISLQGETRVAYLNHRRISNYSVGWRRHIFPGTRGPMENLFVFNDSADGLLALPVSKRADVSAGPESRYQQNGATITSAADVRSALADLKANSDPANVPLDEATQNRIAWFGVELQQMNPELAETNKVSELTNGGTTGAVVTYVYADSPAAKAGIEAGAVLLRLHVASEPQPLEIHVDAGPFEDQPFPWERLDSVPEQYFDRIPSPWPTAENAFNRTLTDLGMGKKFTLEYAVNGKVSKKDFEVAESPTHYASAPKYKSDALGMTVKDVTFEVRRYMQVGPDDPCVIISKLDPGSKAAVAGLRPYELITHVNDQPVRNAAEFEMQVKGKTELRFSVKRMTRGRVVKLTLPAAGETPKDGKADKSDKADKE